MRMSGIEKSRCLDTSNKGGDNQYRLSTAVRNILYFKNNVKIDIKNNVEMLGYKGKEVHISLPAVGKFGGFNFDFFVSDKFVKYDDFEKNPELEKKSYGMDKVCELLTAINNYAIEFGMQNDGDCDYLNGLKKWGNEGKMDVCYAGSWLADFLDFDRRLWLKDCFKINGIDCRVLWNISFSACGFHRIPSWGGWWLFIPCSIGLGENNIFLNNIEEFYVNSNNKGKIF